MTITAQDIRTYYDECDDAYRRYGGEEPYCIHYGFWDRSTVSHVRSLRRMNEEMAAAAAIQPGDRVLDAGCGVGASAVWLAREHGVEVLGITLSEVQRRKAERYAEQAGVADRARFEVRSYLDTGLEAASFDVVWGLESTCYAPDKADFVREARRLLRPGGRLVLADGFAAESCTEVGSDLLARWLAGWYVPNLATESRMRVALQDAGFVDPRFDDITANALPSALIIFKRSALTLRTDPLTDLTVAQRRHIQGGFFQWPALRAGAWRYGLLTARAPR